MLNEILIGDTLKVLKNISNSEFIDMGITSPPYNKKKVGGGIFRKIQYENFDDNLKEEDYQEIQILVLNELYRLIKPGGSFFYNHKVRHEKGIMIHPLEWLTKTKWHLRQEIVWNKKSAVEVGGYRFYQVDERIYWLYKPINKKKLVGKRMEGKDARLSSVWEIIPDRKNPHPAPFPLVLPLRCILSMLRNEKNCIVIDPYMGSGTTGIASKLLNHNYIGIDNSKEYVKMANENIKNFEKFKSILIEEEKLHFVKKSYKERKNEI